MEKRSFLQVLRYVVTLKIIFFFNPFATIFQYLRRTEYSLAAGVTSLEDYFQKGALLGQKAALNLENHMQSVS